MLKKFIKTRFAVAVISAILNFYVKIIFWTCKFIVTESKKAKELLDNDRLCFITLWHSRILVFPKFITNRGKKYSVVISSSTDGEFLASIIRDSGHNIIRGSTRKRAASALRGVIKAIRDNYSVFITPDGPKGPRHKIQGNVVNLAHRYKLPIIPMTYSATSAKVLTTWDRFIIPIPFCKIYVDIGEPIFSVKPTDTQVELIMLDQMKKLDRKTGLKVDY